MPTAIKILIINPFGIGDVLFTTPVISNLRRAYPDAHIAYIGNRRTIEFLKCDPAINHVWSYERDEFHAVYKQNPIAFIRKWLDFIGEIKAQRFDVVFDFSLNSTFGFICMLCGIPRRYGYDYRGRGKYLTHKLPLKGFEGKHVVEHHLNVLRLAGIEVHAASMYMPIREEDKTWAKVWMAKHGLPLKEQAAQGLPSQQASLFNRTIAVLPNASSPKKVVAIVPGGGQSWGAAASKKRWPASKYADLVDKIIADHHAAVILVGDAREEQLCHEVARLVHSPVFSAVGQTSLMQMAAIFKQCDLVIVNDGGPLHVAVASGARTLSIFGPVDETVYGPYPAEGHMVATKYLACRPCYRRFRMAACTHISCLHSLSVEDVYSTLSIEPQ